MVGVASTILRLVTDFHIFNCTSPLSQLRRRFQVPDVRAHAWPGAEIWENSSADVGSSLFSGDVLR